MLQTEILKDLEEEEELVEEKILINNFSNNINILKMSFLVIKNLVSF